MSEYVDVEYTVRLNVHKDDVPTPGDIVDALWDELDAVRDFDSIYVERKGETD